MIYNFYLNIQDSNRWWKFFKSTYLLLFLFFLYIPWLFIVLCSFFAPSKKGNIPLNLSGSYHGGKNYSNFFSDSSYYGGFWDGFLNSLFIAGIVVPFSLFIGLIAVISIWKSYGQYKKTTFVLANASIATPDIVQAISFCALFLLFLVPLGINLGTATIIISHIAFSVPYVIVFLYPKISKINIKILYASYDLKYSKYETIFYVLIPMLLPNIIGAGLLVFSLSFDDFIITNLVRGNVTTLTSEMYTMKRGIKAWAVTFGALTFWLSMMAVIFHTFFNIFMKKNNNK